jgi:hypothetical protein
MSKPKFGPVGGAVITIGDQRATIGGLHGRRRAHRTQPRTLTADSRPVRPRVAATTAPCRKGASTVVDAPGGHIDAAVADSGRAR